MTSGWLTFFGWQSKKRRTVLICLLSGCFIVVTWAGIDFSTTRANAPKLLQKPIEKQVTIQAARKGNPWVNVTNGTTLQSEYVGSGEAVRTLETNAAEPLALASADFDEDGVPDLISGYLSSNGGVLTLHRGNADFLAPNSPNAKAHQATGTWIDSPFLSVADLFEVAAPPEFLAAGDFDADGHADLVFASRKGSQLTWMSGDGQGHFKLAGQTALPGQVTALVAGEINRADGFPDVVVGVSHSTESHVFVFESPTGARYSQPEQWPLPAPATGLALGSIDNDFLMDLAVSAGQELIIFHGRDRKLYADELHHGQEVPVVCEKMAFPALLTAITIGSFVGDAQPEIAVLSADGSVHLVQAQRNHSETKRRQGEKTTTEWSRETLEAHPVPGARQLICAKVSSLPHQDLIVLGQSNQIHILTTDNDARSPVANHELASFDSDHQPIAVLPMCLNQDALTDLVVLRRGESVPTTLVTQPLMTFTVINNNDTGPGSIGQALSDANSTPGMDLITFNISGSTSIPLFGALPTIAESVIINAETQPGFAGTPVVELFNGDAPQGVDGLSIGDGAGNCTIQGLVIRGMTASGIQIQGSGGNVIRDNFLGTDLTGGTGDGNSFDGILINNAPNNIIGGTLPSDRNLISGNFGNGVEIVNSSATGNQILGNLIGTDFSSNVQVANRANGVSLFNTLNNTVGGATLQKRNVISGNVWSNVSIDTDSGIGGNLVQGNFIGTDKNGTAIPPPSGQGIGNGISINNSPGNQIGGVATAPGVPPGNVISGNSFGVVLREITGDRGFQSLATTSNLIKGNLIGTDVTGMVALGNTLGGVKLDSGTNNFIGGPVAGDKNVISGNGGSGIVLSGPGVTTTTIQRNLIGTNLTGTAALPNSNNGVLISNSAGNAVGGITPSGVGNLISGNSGPGVCIQGNNASSNLVQGDLIGTNSGGLAALPNSIGVLIDGAPNNLVGGNTANARNVISGNTAEGIKILNSGATGNTVQGNFIGTNAGGTGALGNMTGVHLSSGANNTSIGGAAAGSGNRIAFNSGNGVLIGDAPADILNGNSVLTNSIFSNGALGIDLGNDGVTPNDPADIDSGPNSFLNFPGITSVTPSSGSTSFSGTFNSTPNTQFRIELFSSQLCDPSGNGEGQNFLGSTLVTTDAGGNASFTTVLAVAITSQSITATATRNVAPFDTSEFSPCVTASNTPPMLGNYPSASVDEGGSTLVTPTTPPTDDGTIVSLTASVPGFTGILTTSISTGVISVSNAKPEGSYVVTVTATDNNGAQASKSFALVVVNVAPSIFPVSPLSRQQGATSSLATIATVSDPGTPAGQLAVSVVKAAPGISVTALTNFNGTISANVEASCSAVLGPNTVTLQVADRSLATSADLTVNVVAGTPSLGTYTASTVNEGGSVLIPSSAPPTNIEGVNFTVTVTPAGFGGNTNFNSETGLVTVTNAKPHGTYTVLVRASSPCGTSISRSFALDVLNLPPTITSAAPPILKQGGTGGVFPIANISDPGTSSGDLKVTAKTIPPGLQLTELTNVNGTVTARIVATCGATPGTNLVALEVSDGNLTATTNLTVEVLANLPPTLGAYQDLSVTTIKTVVIKPALSLNDPDGNLTKVTVTPTTLPGGGTIVIDQATGDVMISVSDGGALLGNYPIQVQAVDSCGAMANRTFTLSVILPGPTNLMAQLVAPTQASLTWTDNSDAESGFKIERRSQSGDFGVIAVVGANTTNFTDGRITPGVKYTYRVKATKKAGDSAPSNEAEIVPSAVSVSQFYPVSSVPGKTITVMGNGFTPGTQVFFGGERRILAANVTLVDATQLKVVVPQSFIESGNINGFLTIRVPGNADITTQDLDRRIENPGQPSSVFSEFVLVGDVDGDGILTANDITNATALVLGQLSATLRQRLAADVFPLNQNGSFGDGSVIAFDVTVLRAVVLGQVKF